MTKKLFKVEIKKEGFFWAEDEAEAQDLFWEQLEKDVEEETYTFSIYMRRHTDAEEIKMAGEKNE